MKKNKNLGKGFIGTIVVIVLAILVAGGIYYYSQNPSFSFIKSGTSLPSEENENNATYPPTPAPISTGSGIEGTVTIGPTCGGPVRPGCEDKPYSTDFKLYSKAGAGDGAETFIKTFQSDKDGKFSINVTPGSYEIRQASSSALPRMSPQFVVVKPNAFAHVDIQFDSGIR